VAAKVLDRMPRLYAAQAASVSPVHRAFEAGAADVAPAESPQPTLAEGIALPRPVRGRRILEALRQSGGGTAIVSEAEIRAAVRTLGRAGFCVEPTSAVVVPALDRLTAAGRIRPGERVVLVLSGFGLKAGALLQDLVG
jgi:threonine synthase